MLHSKKHPESNMMINIAISEAVGLESAEPEAESPGTTTWGVHNQVRNESRTTPGSRVRTPDLKPRHQVTLLANLHCYYMETDEDFSRLWTKYITTRASAVLSKDAQRDLRNHGNIDAESLVAARRSWSWWRPDDEEVGLLRNWGLQDLTFLSHVQLNGEITVKSGTWLLSKVALRDTSVPLKVPECMWFVKVNRIFSHRKNCMLHDSTEDVFLCVEWYRTKPGRTYDVELQSPLVEKTRYQGNDYRRSSVVSIKDVHAVAFAVLPHPVHSENANIALCRWPHALEADLLPCPFPCLMYP